MSDLSMLINGLKVTAENNAMIGFQKLPVLWKAWLVLAMLLSVVTVVAVIVTGK